MMTFSENDGYLSENDASRLCLKPKMMDFVLTMMDFVFKMMNFVLKMMDFVLK